MDVKIATAIAVAGVLVAAGSAAAVNGNVLEGSSTSPVGDTSVVPTETDTSDPSVTQVITTTETASPASTDAPDDSDGRPDRSGPGRGGGDRTDGARPSPSTSASDDGHRRHGGRDRAAEDARDAAEDAADDARDAAEDAADDARDAAEDAADDARDAAEDARDDD